MDIFECDGGGLYPGGGKCGLEGLEEGFELGALEEVGWAEG